LGKSCANIAAMSNIKSIRSKLGVTQSALADGIGCTQANVGHYEKGQSIPPEMARKVIHFAKSRGLVVSFDDIYGAEAAQPSQQVA